MRFRPTVLTDTTLEVAMTVKRLVATAILIGRPITLLRNGTRSAAPNAQECAQTAGDGPRGHHDGDGEWSDDQRQELSTR